jgi:hypothetical protein
MQLRTCFRFGAVSSGLVAFLMLIANSASDLPTVSYRVLLRWGRSPFVVIAGVLHVAHRVQKVEGKAIQSNLVLLLTTHFVWSWLLMVAILKLCSSIDGSEVGERFPQTQLELELSSASGRADSLHTQPVQSRFNSTDEVVAPRRCGPDLLRKR